MPAELHQYWQYSISHSAGALPALRQLYEGLPGQSGYQEVNDKGYEQKQQQAEWLSGNDSARAGRSAQLPGWLIDGEAHR